MFLRLYNYESIEALSNKQHYLGLAGRMKVAWAATKRVMGDRYGDISETPVF